MNTLLEIKDVSLIYHTKSGETTAVDTLSFNCTEGEFVSIIGPSGCGKTTVLSMIAGLITPSRGKILFDGKTFKAGDDNVGYMLQKDHLLPWRTVEKNILLPLEIKKINDEAHRNYALSLLDKYGLTEFKNYYPNQLSGGMRQRVALIRTLTSNPKLLLLDEPFSALDFQTRLVLCDDVASIIKRENKTTILVTHDISEAISLSDRIIVLTNRPATVKKIHEIKIDAETPLAKRNKPEFNKWFDKLWKELNQ